jgi:hypothetical protein
MSDYTGYHNHSIIADASLEISYWQPTFKQDNSNHSIKTDADLKISYWKVNVIDLGALTYFDWEYPKISGEPYNLHANEWNILVEFVRIALPLFGMTQTLNNVKKNETVIRSFNTIVTALKRFNLSMQLPPVITMENPYVYANYFAQIKNYCNELARINNNGGTLNIHKIKAAANLEVNYWQPTSETCIHKHTIQMAASLSINYYTET